MLDSDFWNSFIFVYFTILLRIVNLMYFSRILLLCCDLSMIKLRLKGFGGRRTGRGNAVPTANFVVDEMQLYFIIDTSLC